MFSGGTYNNSLYDLFTFNYSFFNPASGEEVGTIVLEMFRENSIFPLGELLGGLQIFFSSVIPVVQLLGYQP